MSPNQFLYSLYFVKMIWPRFKRFICSVRVECGQVDLDYVQSEISGLNSQNINIRSNGEAQSYIESENCVKGPSIWAKTDKRSALPIYYSDEVPLPKIIYSSGVDYL